MNRKVEVPIIEPELFPNNFRGQEYPLSFHFFSEFKLKEPHEGEIVGFNSFDFNSVLIWEIDALGKGMVSCIGDKRKRS